MKLDEFATRVLDAADAAGIDFMVVGAIAAGAYGVPRSTKDIDLLVAVHAGQELELLRRHLCRCRVRSAGHVRHVDVGAAACG